MDIDKKLVANTLDGDMDSFSALVTNYQERIYNFLLRLTLCREDAEELLQDVFVRVYKYLYTYNHSMSFSTWLYRIALNTFKDYHKRNKRKPATFCYDEAVDTYGDSKNHPEVAYETKEKFKEIVKIINSLKEEQRIAIILKYIQDFSYKEIGEILSITPENAKMRVSRARKTIGLSFRDENGGAF